MDNDQFNEVVYILAMMINPFKNQVDLDEENAIGKEYMDGCNEDNIYHYETVYRAFTDNGFVSFPGAKENWYYKNMFA